MIKHMFAIHDLKADVFNFYNLFLTVPEAIREFTSMVLNPGSVERPNRLFTNSEDYSLYHLGKINELTGEVVGLPQTQVITALACKSTSV